MALEAGSVFVRLSGLFNKAGFDDYDKALGKAETAARTPINAQLGADSSQLDQELVAARTKLGVYKKDEYDTQLGANLSPFERDMATARAELDKWGNETTDTTLGVDDTEALTEYAKLEALRKAWQKAKATAQFKVDTAQANAALDAIEAKMLAIRATDPFANLKKQSADAGVAIQAVERDLARVSSASGSGRDSGGTSERSLSNFLSALINGRNGSSDQSITKYFGNMSRTMPVASASSLKNIWFGNEGSGFEGFPSISEALGKLPSFGSLGSLAGFGPEHFVLTGAGLGVSALSGLAGAGLLAGGALTKGAVTGGADALVGLETTSATKSLYTDQVAVNNAIKEYGKDSTEAVTAQRTLNAQMSEYGKVAGDAEAKTAKMAASLVSSFEDATQKAQAAKSGIYQDFISVAGTYVKPIASADTRNITETAAALKPLESWLKGSGGHNIFNQLESDEAKSIPTTIHAISQALESFLKLMTTAANYDTRHGGLMDKLNEWFSKKNAEPIADYDKEVNKLADDMHRWGTFLKLFFDDIKDAVKWDAGTATTIIGTLDGFLERLNKWETSQKGENSLKNLFSVHKQEFVQLLDFFDELAKGYGNFYINVAPNVVKAVTLVIGALSKLLELISKVPGGDFAIGLGIVLDKLHLLGPAFTLAEKGAGSFLRSMTGMSSSGGAIGSVIDGWIAKLKEFIGLNKDAEGATAVDAAESDVASDTTKTSSSSGFFTKLLGSSSGVTGIHGGIGGTVANPVAVMVVAGETVGEQSYSPKVTEETAAQSEAEATTEAAAAGGSTVLGQAASDVEANAGGEASGVEVGLLSKVTGTLGDIAGKLGVGGAIAIGGTLASKGIGDLVKGSAGHDIASIGGDVAKGAGIGAVAGSVIPGVGTVIGAGVGAAAGGILGAFKDIPGVSKLASDGLSEIGKLIKPLDPQLQQLGRAASSAFGAVKSAVESVGSEFWSGISDDAKLVAKAFDAVKSAVESVGSEFWSGISDDAKLVAKAFDDLAIKSGFLKDAFDTAIKGIETIAKSWITALTGVFDIISGLFTGNWNKLWTGVKDVFKGAVDGILGVAETLGAPLIGAFEAIAPKVEKIFSDLGSTVVKTVKGMGSDVIKGVEDIGKDIANLASVFLHDAEDLGENVVKGIKKGVGNLGSDAVNTVKGLGSDVLGGLKSVLSIFSPSKATEEVGQNLVRGLINGLQDTSLTKLAQTALVTPVTDALNTINTTVTSDLQLNPLTQEVTKDLTSMSNSFQQLLQNVQIYMQQLQTLWKQTFITDLPQGTQTGMTRVLQDIQVSLKDVIADAKSLLPELPQALSNAMATANADITQGFNTAINTVKKSMTDMTTTTSSGMKAVNKLVKSELKDLGDSSLKSTSSTSSTKKYAGGGFAPGSEFGLGDNMLLVDPTGTPRAALAGDEAIFTRHQMPYVEAGLQAIGFGGASDLWNSVSRPHGFATGGGLSSISVTGSGETAEVASDALSLVITQAGDLVSRAGSTASSIGGVSVSTSEIPAGEHKATIAEGLKAAGVANTSQNEAAVNLIINHESSWNADAVNKSDINWQEGHPSVGLMQTIAGTFAEYVPASLKNQGPFLYGVSVNPIANIAAGVRYAVSRYGSLDKVPGVVAVTEGAGYVGYRSGGRLNIPSDIPHFKTGGSITKTPDTKKSTTAKTSGALSSVLSYLQDAEELPKSLRWIGKLVKNFTTDDDTVSNLSNVYDQEQQLFELYDEGSTGDLPLQDLNKLEANQEDQWNIYYNEYTQLPTAISKLKAEAKTLIGTKAYEAIVGGGKTGDTKKTKAGSTGSSVLSTAAQNAASSGSDTAETVGKKKYVPGSGVDLTLEVLGKDETLVTGLEDTLKTIDLRAEESSHKASAEAQTIAQVYAVKVNSLTQDLINDTNSSIAQTESIARLTQQLAITTNAKTAASLETKITAAQDARAASSQASTIQNKLTQVKLDQTEAADKYKDEGFWVAWKDANEKLGLEKQIDTLNVAVQKLKKLLTQEQKDLAYIIGSSGVGSVSDGTTTYADSDLSDPKGGLLQALEYRLNGAPDGSETAISTSLEDIGYNILNLVTQGAKQPQTRKFKLSQVTDLYKKMGIALPVDYSASGAIAGSTEEQALTDLQTFTSALQTTFADFGSNFAATGTNPFSSTAGLAANTQYYGAASGGSGLGPVPGPASTSTGDTNINIEQNFASGPPAPHTYAAGLTHELSAMV